MSQDTEKYLYFKVGLLKDSFALEALWQDALKYHMIDQPAKLIAMRLTEYYELTKKGQVHPTASTPMPTESAPGTSMPTVLNHRGNSDKENKEDIETPTSSTPAIRPPVVRPPVARPLVTRPTTDQVAAPHPENEASLTVSSEVDQNAEEAADYWSLL